MKGILILMNCHKARVRNMAHSETLQKIYVLEVVHKDKLQKYDYFRLQELYAALNVLDASKTGHQLLHKKQKIF